jgi:hypothetical protein
MCLRFHEEDERLPVVAFMLTRVLPLLQ